MRRPVLLSILLAVTASVVHAQSTPYDALVQGEVKFVLRYRFERVDDEAFTRAAVASLLRSRMTYRSAAWQRWSVLAEIDDVHAIGGRRYNDTRNARADLATVADPEGTGLNQALLQYVGSRHSLVLGRQRLLLDDQRFVGGSGWRQNEQTFDALTLRARLPRADLSYSYVANVSRVFGPKRGMPAADLQGDTHLVNARLDVGSLGSLVLFDYLLDLDDAPTLSSNTLGLRATGNHPLLGRTRWLHTLSLARQTDAGANPVAARTRYTQLELGLRRGMWSALLGRETLSGHASLPGRVFQAPLGTLHLFQGWADKFGTTPPQGIDDRYFALVGAWRQIKVQLAWHDFGADAVARDYGHELDASFTWQIARQYELLLKAADYRSDGFAADTRKLWLQLNAAF